MPFDPAATPTVLAHNNGLDPGPSLGEAIAGTVLLLGLFCAVIAGVPYFAHQQKIARDVDVAARAVVAVNTKFMTTTAQEQTARRIDHCIEDAPTPAALTRGFWPRPTAAAIHAAAVVMARACMASVSLAPQHTPGSSKLLHENRRSTP